MDEILNTLETLAWWFREAHTVSGGSPLYGSAIIMDDERTIREHVNKALENARRLDAAFRK